MAAENTLGEVFERLREILIPYANDLDLKKDSSDSVYIDTLHIMKNKKPLFFGAVQIQKRYVAYHLMPVYVSPDLLDDISDDLKKCMQGKSCFNFNKVDDELFDELEALTRLGHEFYRKEGYV